MCSCTPLPPTGADSGNPVQTYWRRRQQLVDVDKIYFISLLFMKLYPAIVLLQLISMDQRISRLRKTNSPSYAVFLHRRCTRT